MAKPDNKDRLQIPATQSPEADVPESNSGDSERKIGRSMLFKVALASLIVSSLIISVSCLMEYNRLETQKAELENQIDDYNEKIARLQYYINRDIDEEYIAEYAREYLGLTFPDDIIVHDDVPD